jgi:DNA-binding response OmpR family regulator
MFYEHLRSYGKAMNPHILVVDDDPELILLFRLTLELNFDVSEATDGVQALALARDSIPDLILLDVMMPGLDGFEVCRRLKADGRTGSIPIVFVTARADVLTHVEKLKIPVDDVISKPFRTRELVQRVNELLQRNDGDHASSGLQPVPAPV